MCVCVRARVRACASERACERESMCVRECECVRVSVCACVRACVCGCGHDLKMTLRPALRTILTVDLNALDSSYKRHHSVSRRAEAGG